MDTMWFAVDGAGEVGLFSSGENGHVPEGVAVGTDELVRELVLAAPGVVFANRFGPSLVPPSASAWHATPQPGEHPFPYGLCLFLLNDAWLRPALEEGRARPAVTPWDVPLYLAEGLDDTAHGLLHLDGACLACFDAEELFWEQLPGLLGLHDFHDTDDRSGQYRPLARGPGPWMPLRIDQLPPDLARRLAAIRYPAIRFATADLIWPLRHHPVYTSGSNDYWDPEARRWQRIPKW
jgi:hypothetical protein